MTIPSYSGLNTALSGLEAAQAAIDTTGQNIANANTPGYVAKDLKELDFKSLIGRQRGYGPLQLAATEPGHIAPVAPNNPAPVVTVSSDQSLDGNGVSLEQQMMKVSSNAAEYALVTTIYKDNVSMIKTALGSGGASG